MFSEDTALLLHSQVIPPSSNNNQEESTEISTTNITNITSPDIVKELLAPEPTELESSPKRVKTG